MKKLGSLFAFTNLILLFVVYFFFLSFQEIHSQNILRTTRSLFSKEENLINPLNLSQSLIDLNTLDLIDCVKLVRVKDNFTFLKLNDNSSRCHKSMVVNGKFLSNQFHSSNGTIWEISFLVMNPPHFNWLLSFAILLEFLLTLIIFGWIYVRERYHQKISKIEKDNADWKLQITKQVAHDIRSPLAALKMAVEEIEQMPEDYRNMIRGSVQRINDIANNLLSTHKEKLNSHSAILYVEFLAPLVDSLVSEKRMQYRNNINIEIVADLSKSYGLFANVNAVELIRVLSNTINNAVESFKVQGKITVKIAEVDDRILLSIRDNGKGIPASILAKLGEQGFSYGKEGSESGSGLGIYHAKATIQSFGGNFEVESKENEGTLIKMYLPKANTPSWFVKELHVNRDLPLFILDDDESIHQLWAKCLPQKIINFTDGDKFSQTVEKMKGQSFLCLIDFELLGQSQTGLNIIENLQIAEKSILVTSRFDQQEVQAHACKLGVQIIPKTLVSLVPIKFQDSLESQIFDCVYIEDDELLRLGWERRARKSNLKLLTLKSTEEFKQFTDQICKTRTRVYIDSSLGEDKMRGEDFAQILHNEGYQLLFIASGYEPERFAHLPWLQCTGKDYPF